MLFEPRRQKKLHDSGQGHGLSLSLMRLITSENDSDFEISAPFSRTQLDVFVITFRMGQHVQIRGYTADC